VLICDADPDASLEEEVGHVLKKGDFIMDDEDMRRLPNDSVILVKTNM